ncbi:PulJ/GspJ family protein [Verrucomicrobium spinosum]|uniref:PulJ/GspJ family protein n=1 Tax=Verrucomicrobium spinosum TaxID=2736 RepID=UPI0009D6E765|nr:prepilin-type N-terminal cleavage/methylation domain-containing protein [Verrucomicrobium spinosum]
MQASPDTDHRASSARRAFTLVELLVSISVLALIVALLGSSLTEVSRAWTRGEGNAERRGSSRALADFLASELQGALLPVEGTDPRGQGNLQFLASPPAARLPAGCAWSDSLFWQTPQAMETTFGEIAVVGYFIKWTDGRPMLCRLFIPPSARQDGVVSKNPDFRVYDSNPDAWLDAGIVSRNAAPDDKAGGYRGLFADLVPGFWVQCYGLDGQALPRTYDSRQGYDCRFQPEGRLSYTEKRYLPATVRVSLAQVDSGHEFELAQAADEVRAIAADPAVRDAATFLQRIQSAAESSPTLAALLPGLRTYTTEIQMLHSR